VGEPRAEELRRLVRSVTVEVDQIRYLKDTLFDHLVDLEAGRDALTQLLNRRFLPSILSREVELSRRANKPFSLLLIDVDHFKDINDQHGHDAGDRVLQHLANVLVNVVRSGDFVFRYGGEEFLIISVEITPEQALQVAEKIRRAVENEAFLLSNGRTLRATISVGVAPHTGHPDYQHLIERADLALYAAKQAGRNRCIVRN
jgi:diguanylate cyclase